MSSIAVKQPLLHIQTAKVQASLGNCIVSPEPLLLAHINSRSWGTFSEKPSHAHWNIDVTYCQREDFRNALKSTMHSNQKFLKAVTVKSSFLGKVYGNNSVMLTLIRAKK